jgi:hypothetical protein
MNRTPDDATRLMNLLVAICGDPSDFCPGWAVFHQFEITMRIPTIATTDSDGSRPPVPIDRDQCGAGADGAVG